MLGIQFSNTIIHSARCSASKASQVTMSPRLVFCIKKNTEGELLKERHPSSRLDHICIHEIHLLLLCGLFSRCERRWKCCTIASTR